MTDQELRELQDRFLRVLTENGFFARNKDGWSLRLFNPNDPDCPNALQIKQRLYPAYREQMEDYLNRFEKIEDLTV